MTQKTFPPEKPLNLVMKKLILQNLRRTDIYFVENNDPENLFFSTSVKNFRDETLIKYDNDRDQGTHTITFMGEVVAKMELHISMNLTKQHEDILDVVRKIDAKSDESKDMFKEKQKMSKVENLVYERARRELQNARDD